MSAGALIFLSILNLLLPFALGEVSKGFNLSIQTTGLVSTLHEVLSSSLSFAFFYVFSSKERSWKDYLIRALGCLIFADFTYGIITYVLQVPSPREYLPLIHEIPYALFAWLLAISSLTRAMERISKKSEYITSAIIVLVASAFYFVLSIKLVLVPFFNDHLARPKIMYVTSTTYALGQSISVGALILSSLRALDIFEFVLWFSFLILNGSDFALRYQDLSNTTSTMPFFEYGWQFALAAISSTVMLRPWFKSAKWSKIPQAPLKSVRVLAASCALLALISFVALSNYLGSYFSGTTAMNIGFYVILFFVIWACSNLFSIIASDVISKQVRKTARALVESTGEERTNTLLEMEEGFSVIQEMRQTLDETLSKNVRLKADAEVGLMMAQVAHDIRSPIAALDVAISDLVNIDENSRILIRAANRRIKEIASTLLKSKNSNNGYPSSGPQHLLSLLDEVVNEKAALLAVEERIDIDLIQSENSYAVFATLEPVEFKRIISNLIDNSIQAIRKQGRISIYLNQVANETIIQVVDNGSGMAAPVLKEVSERGGSHGKTSGYGLGISHAKQCLARWDAKLEYESEPEIGTKATIRLRKEGAPNWFCDIVVLPTNSRIAVVDDDPSIHQIWNQKLNPFGKQILHFHELGSFDDWINSNDHHDLIVFMDFEFKESIRNGLDLLTNYTFKGKYLITSHYSDFTIQDHCSKNQVKVAPKGLVGFMPLAREHENLRNDLVDMKLSPLTTA